MATSVGVDPLAEFGILCRLCGAKTSILLGLHIFDREGNLREICKKIKACLPIQVTNDDKLPKMVCEECVYKLDELYEFREKSVKTEYFLTSMLKGLMATPRVSSQQYAVQRPSVQIGNLMCASNVHSSEIQLRPQVEVHITNHSIQLESIITSLPLNDANMVKTESEFDGLKNNSDNLGPRSVETDTNDSIVTSVDVDHSQDNCTITEHIVNNIQVADIRSLHAMSGAGLKTTDVDGDRHFIVTATHSDHPWFFCDICGKPFGDSNEFQAHCEIHWKKCNACGVTCANDDALILHLREAHEETSSLQPVQISVQDSTMVTVPQSGADSPNVGLSEKDHASISEQIPEEQNAASHPKIDELNQSLEGANEETTPPHTESTTDKISLASDPKACVECNKRFRTNYKLSEHMRKHTGEKPYKCSTCEKTYRSKIGLAQHEARHTGQYDFTCNTCGKGFQCKSYLIVHQRVHSDLKPFPCETCGRDFKTKQSLLDHQNRHLGVKPFQCDVCGRGFITKGLCKSHQKIHSGTDNRQFPCSVCSKLFVSKSYLATHMRIHTGEKPFMCEVCGKGFVTRVDLRIHSTMHTGEKSFVCEMCGKAFARRDALRCHKRSHTGERPYVCDICGQGFTQFTPMAIHKRLHTGERPYTCDMCDKTFVSKSTMMSHKKKHAWFQKPTETLAAPETTQSFTEVYVVSNDSPTFVDDTCSAPQMQ